MSDGGGARKDGSAAPGGHDAVVHQRLLANAKSYDFFVTVGMLEQLTSDAVRVGGDGPPGGEAIRFRHDPSLAFSAGDISKLEWVEVPRGVHDALERKRHRYVVTTTFLGLIGSATPMPLFMAEELAQAQEQGRVRRDFLDLFHHRLLSLVYRVGVKHDIPSDFSTDTTDAWTRRVLELAGFDVWSGRRTKHIPLWQLARLAPLLAARSRSASVIERALQDLCGEALGDAVVEVLQFAGGWSPIDPEQRTQLAVRNSILGHSAVLGAQCFDRAGKAVIRIGPLHENFRRFLADGDMYPRVRELLGLMSPEPIEFELDLVLAEHARPPFRLGTSAGRRIGVDAWLSSRQGAAGRTHLKVAMPVVERPNPDHEANSAYE